MLYVSGSDGNIYEEPYEGTITGSLYKTKYITITEDDGEFTYIVPGILFDTNNDQYYDNMVHTQAQLIDGTNCFDSGSMEGCVWVYNINEASKSVIESDADYISSLADSNL